MTWCRRRFERDSVLIEGCDSTVRDGRPGLLGWFEKLFN
jgi:hypothetical protein